MVQIPTPGFFRSWGFHIRHSNAVVSLLRRKSSNTRYHTPSGLFARIARRKLITQYAQASNRSHTDARDRSGGI